MSCLDDTQAIEFVERRLAEDEWAAVEKHIDRCVRCRQLVHGLGMGLVPAEPSTNLAAAPPDRKTRFAIDALIADRYRIVRFVARGGMGEVYEAHDLELHQSVALKTVRREIETDAAALQLFKREISLARRVTHANVCRIFDVGFHAPPGAARCAFLTMELLSGETLAERLKRSGPIPTDVARPLVEQMASALAAAHQSGVIHRDFKART